MEQTYRVRCTALNMNYSNNAFLYILLGVQAQISKITNKTILRILPSNQRQDTYEKVDAIIYYDDDTQDTIQFKFNRPGSPFAEYNLVPIRTISHNSYDQEVQSEFWRGDKITFYVWGVADDTGKVYRYVILDFKKLFALFNVNIFRHTDTRSEFDKATKFHHDWYFYKEFEYKSDGNRELMLPLLSSCTFYGNFDKSIEKLWNDIILYKEGF